jgi:hypothetical protein
MTQFTKPDVQQVQAYCRERGNKINAEQFFDFYEANGWVQGRAGKPLKDWRAAVRTWERMPQYDSGGLPKEHVCRPPTKEDIDRWNGEYA